MQLLSQFNHSMVDLEAFAVPEMWEVMIPPFENGVLHSWPFTADDFKWMQLLLIEGCLNDHLTVIKITYEWMVERIASYLPTSALLAFCSTEVDMSDAATQCDSDWWDSSSKA